MRFGIVALLSGVAVAALGLSALPAAAAPKERAAVTAKSDEVSSQRRRVRRYSRARTRITVRRRTYLDAGTETLQGERKYSDYAFPRGYVPTSVISGYQGQFATESPWSSHFGAGFSIP